MTGTTHSTITPRELVHIFIRRRRLWIVPTVVCTVVGVLAAATMSRKWEASQGLIVRQEASGGQQRPGSFSSMEEMKRIQETILEIAKSHSVVTRTLVEVGPPPSLLPRRSQWPSQEAVESFRESIRMTPPGGAEFGLTEVVYLAVRSPDRQRALKLLSTLCEQLEARFMEVRDERADSMIDELEKTVARAEQDLEEATVRLAGFESSVGADLTELRMLLDSPSGTSDLRQMLVSLENSKQEYAAQRQQQKKLLEMLEAARQDPLALIATPNSLLDAQPALRRLKEGLIEAQLLTSRLLGRLSAAHPEVVTARHAEQEVRDSLRRELETAIRGVEVDLRISTDQIETIEQEIARGRKQLEHLASLRARYANLVALTGDRTRLLEEARKNLADAQASKASARAASLIGRIDAPYMAPNPVGPGRTVIAAAGTAGGLAIGVALVFLFGLPAPSETPAQPVTTATIATADAPSNEPAMETAAKTAATPAPPPEPTSPPTPELTPEPTPEATPEPTPAPTLAAATAPFGMFQGKTLRQAVEEVRRQSHEDS